MHIEMSGDTGDLQIVSHLAILLFDITFCWTSSCGVPRQLKKQPSLKGGHARLEGIKESDPDVVEHTNH